MNSKDSNDEPAHQLQMLSDNQVSGESSAKYGRRSSSTISRYKSADTYPEDVIGSTSQAELERSWRGLNEFRRYHKGRLDSANDIKDIRQVRHLDRENPIYSPSILENVVPIRSKSEMSNSMPHYVYDNIKKATEHSGSDNLTEVPTKSKSSENVHTETEEMYENQIDKSLNRYKLKVAEENHFRNQMIRELLLENAKISENLNKNIDVVTCSVVPKYSTLKKHLTPRNLEGDMITEDKHEEVFIIPELPSGKTLVIEILSTWGDRHYVGLNGIEIFGSDGCIAEVDSISASPSDVNILPECKDDPRVVTNLLDGVNRTQDDVHLWLAPFDIMSDHTITITFRDITTLAMIRIWNYNKSRIHSYRGVREIVMLLDNVPIFKGEIAKACGGILGGVDAFGDTILFTTDENILEQISHNDNSYFTLIDTYSSMEAVEDRPPTSLNSQSRPVTGVAKTKPSLMKTPTTESNEEILFGGFRLDIILLSNWGAPSTIGLTGIEVIADSDICLNLSENNLICSVRSPHLGRLVDGVNITTNRDSMWSVPYRYGEEILLSCFFDAFTYLSGIRIWNYNESAEMTHVGVHSLKVQLDGIPILNPLNKTEIFLMRRAPGNTHYDYVQDIKFSRHRDTIFEDNIEECAPEDVSELYVNPSMPTGFVFQIIIFSSWGDQYYCGLNGLELYGRQGRKINLEEHNICAYPESINALPNVSGDIRTPDKLIDGINADHSGAHSWLAPIIPKCLNRIYIVLDQPTTVSYIKLWNYSKTPGRGVKEFGILVDDLLIYNGILDKCLHRKGAVNYKTILFSNEENFANQTNPAIVRHSGQEQDVLLLNDNLRSVTGGSLPNPDQALRPFTSVSPFNRGFTSYSN